MEQLSPKVRIKWAFNYVVGAIAVLLIAYVLDGLLSSLLHLEQGTIFNAALGLVIVVLIPYLIYIELMYRHFKYQLGDTELIIKKGIINIRQVVVPYERIQNINVHMDVLCRMLGIATVRIETAGMVAMEAEIDLPGIENPHELVRTMIAKVEEAKGKAKEKEVDKLTEELKGLREALEGIKEMVKTTHAKMEELQSRLNEIDRHVSLNASRISIIEQRQTRQEERMDSIADLLDEITDYINPKKEEKVKKEKKTKREKKGKGRKKSK